MGYGTIILSGFGNRDMKIKIIKKIWKKFGMTGFVSSQLTGILTKGEKKMANMNRWKHANLVSHAGWGKINGKPYRKWKLTTQTIERCVKNEV